MATFEDFVQGEMPKRPYSDVDGAEGDIPVRSANSNRPRELVWKRPGDIVAAPESTTDLVAIYRLST